MTSERLGCYRPEEHIDNPKDYADNIDARQYHRALRGPVDERRELAIDERNGMKNYIASEDLGITTSSGLVRNLFGKAIDLGRKYKHSKDDKDFFEALRLLGTGCHCLEDFSAHSNYTELALIEMGERDIFPHVGRRTQMQVRGARNPVFPIVTGTFGGVDFLHSVMGEFSDKATQSELEELEGAISHAKNSDTSLLKDILKKIPSGVFGSGSDDPAGKADELQSNANAAHMENMHISPKEPEAFTRQVNDIMKQIYPIIEFHDNIMKGISSAIDKIPILPDLIEELQDQVNLFVFSLLAPYIMPIISQVKNELHTGSSEVIKSSQEHQMAVFSNDNDTDPTHSMLSKDHFSNQLNEPAGKVASAVLKWVVPQIVECWDDDNADIARTLDRIVNGVLHHPALREYGDDGARDGRGLMFREVEKWWNDMGDRERDSLRRSLSREGVQHFKNHKEGVKDKGHGCGKPLGLPTRDTYESSGATGGKSSDAGDLLGGIASALGNSSGGSGNSGGGFNSKHQEQISDKVSEAVGGGAIGSIVGGFASNIIGNAAKNVEKKSNSSHENGSTYNPSHQSGNSYSSNQQSSGHGQGSSYNSGNQGSGSYGSNQQSSGYGRDDSYGSNQQSSGYGRDNSHGSGNQSSGYGRDNSSSSYQSGGYNQTTSHSSGGYQSSQQQSGYSSQADQYGYSGRRDEYGQESHSGRTGYGSSAHEGRSERRHESNDLLQNTDFGGRTSDHRQTKHNSSRRDDSDDDDSNDDDDYEKKQRKREKKEQKRLKKQREEEEKKSSYGGSSRRDDYGSSSRRDDDDYPARQPAYGQEQNYSSGYGRQTESSHSQSSRYEQSSGSSRYEQSSSSGYGGNTHSSSDRYESSTPSYGGNSHSSSEYPGNHGRTSGGYGSSGYGDDSRGNSGYGNTQSSSAEYGSSGYGNESRHHGSSERREGHGRRDEYGDSGSADMPGSFGGGESYGESRRRNEGDGYGNSGYGNSGYGGSSGGYGSRY